MPFINTKVNMPLDRQQQREVKERLGRAIALLPGKSEQYLMVGFEPDYPLYFQGDDGERPPPWWRSPCSAARRLPPTGN